MTPRSLGFACVLAIASGAVVSPSNAQTPDISPSEVAASAGSPAPSALFASPYLPQGANLRELLRLYNGNHQRHASLTYFPQNWNEFGWRQEGTHGFISATPFENSRPLYLCQLNDVFPALFTSKEPGCEGQFLTSFGLIGYISTVPLPDTAPLYRCQYVHKRRLHHFDTRMANCEHANQSTNDGILGYVFL